MKNKNIILTVGIPASGKSTWRETFLKENSKYVCVSRDDFRFMLRNEPMLTPNGESMITDLVEATIKKSIDNGFGVIVDQTNVNIRYLDKMVSFCEKLGDVTFIVFDIALDDAIERDKNRERSVGEEVIRRMYENFQNMKKNYDFSKRDKIK